MKSPLNKFSEKSDAFSFTFEVAEIIAQKNPDLINQGVNCYFMKSCFAKLRKQRLLSLQ